MDSGFQFVCLKQSKRFIWIMGITFAVVMVVQHFELPHGSELSSLLSSKVPFIRKSYYPSGELSGDYDIIVRGTTNDTEASTSGKETIYGNVERDKDTKIGLISETNGGLKGEIGLVSNHTSFEKSIDESKNSISKDEKSSVCSGTTEKAIYLEHNISSKQITESNGSSSGNIEKVNNNSSLTDLPAMNKKFNMSTIPVMPISKMNEFLQRSHSSPHSLPPKLYSKVDQELINAKSMIDNALSIKNDSELYAALYHNVSMFKRSYEIMENKLRVYIYKEGEKPIFHDSILEGIYACEGWFLKLLEANKQFVTEDPREAHLFYLPFSSRLLELTLYVRHSHSRDNLIQYMKNYVDMLIAKYPFWNRTDGADHFLAACHDWAPAETRGRMLKCIRALCNADIKTGFQIGRDVSIPTTYVRSSKNPMKDIGGDPPSQRPILAFFAGYMHGNVRPVLLNHWGNDSDMKIFNRMPHVKGNKNYIQHMKSSKYCICARGFAVNSPRVVESLFYECVPVIISDNYVPPLFEVLNWESFAVFILEKDIPNLKKILLSVSEEKYLEMLKRVKRVQQHFLWHVEPVKYDLFHMILHSIWYNRLFRIRPT